MEPMAMLYLSLFFLILINVFILGRRIYLKTEKNDDRNHLKVFIVTLMVFPFIFIFMPITKDITPIDKNSKIITTKITKMEHYIIIDNDTIYYYTDGKTIDTLSNKILPDSLSLNLITRYTIYGQIFNKEIKNEE